jgi:hypothetical protein
LSGEAVLTVAYLIFKFQFILSKNVEFERKKNENHENDDSDEIIEMPQNDEPSFFFLMAMTNHLKRTVSK